MADDTRRVRAMGMVYLPGGTHPFPAGTELDLPADVADALDAAGHLHPAPAPAPAPVPAEDQPPHD